MCPGASTKSMQTQIAYKMIGADGGEYGPATLSEFKQWVREGRVSGATLVTRTDQESWSTAASFPELGVIDSIAGAPGESAADPTEVAELEKKVKSHGSWFYWIAGLSIINSIVAFSGSEWGFFLGFSVLQAIDYAVKESGTAIRAGVLAFDLVAAGSFIVLGIFACRQHAAWAFIVGVVFYGLDTALTILAIFAGGSAVGGALHVWALVSLILGITAANKLKKLRPVVPVCKSVPDAVARGA
jgi:hypothetical protein